MRTYLLLLVLASCVNMSAVTHLLAVEPNEFFGEATVLPPGTLAVDDELSAAFVLFPDTLLGTRGIFGEIQYVDDDGSPVGDGTASGVGGVPTNSGSISFAVTGFWG